MSRLKDMSLPEVNSMVDFLDSLTIRVDDVEKLKEVPSWYRDIIRNVLQQHVPLVERLKVMQAFEKMGIRQKDIEKLSNDDELRRQVLALVQGYVEVVPVKHLIDFDKPFAVHDKNIPLSSENQLPNQVRGIWEWDPAKVQLFEDERQISGYYGIQGVDLQTLLIDKKVYNANLLDYLLKFPFLIPESWKDMEVHFWGTLYNGQFGDIVVRFLCFDRHGWGSGTHSVNRSFVAVQPVACWAE